jgi:hypothetical protein
LVNPLQVQVTNTNRALVLDDARDYVVHMPATPLTASGGLTISGGHHVVLIGGHISIPWQGSQPRSHSRRGLFLKNQTGTVHVEGLLIDGTDLAEGINLDQRRGSVVQIENVRVIGVHARDEVGFTDTHPDVIQTWAGPTYLRVDRLTATTDYQGFFLHPTQYDTNANIKLADFRHVNISGTTTSGYLLWQATPFPLTASDVYVQPAPARQSRPTLWPSVSAWSNVKVGIPFSGDFAITGTAGSKYVSPGYVG